MEEGRGEGGGEQRGSGEMRFTTTTTTTTTTSTATTTYPVARVGRRETHGTRLTLEGGLEGAATVDLGRRSHKGRGDTKGRKSNHDLHDDA